MAIRLSNVGNGTSLEYHGNYHQLNEESNTDNGIEISILANTKASEPHIIQADNWDKSQITPSSTYNTWSGLRGIILNGECLTLTAQPYEIINGKIDFNIGGNYVGNAFNNYLYTSTGGARNTWGFECYFKVSQLPASNQVLMLVQSGFNDGWTMATNTNVNSTGKQYYTNYRVYVNSNGEIIFRYNYHNGTKWTETKKGVNSHLAGSLNSNGYRASNQTSANVIPAVVPNKWYHLCMIRLCDGNTSHGFSTSMRTLMKLNEINGSVEVYAQNNSYLWDKINNYLKVRCHTKNTTTTSYAFPISLTTNTTTTTFANSLLNDFKSIGVATSDGFFGRLGGTNHKEYDTTINLRSIGDNNIEFAGNIYWVGGAYYQSVLKYNTNDGTVYTYTDEPLSPGYSLSAIASGSQTHTIRYVYRPSIEL